MLAKILLINLGADRHRLSPCLSINEIAWRPIVNEASTSDTRKCEGEDVIADIAIASDDSSLRILSLRLSSLS